MLKVMKAFSEIIGDLHCGKIDGKGMAVAFLDPSFLGSNSISVAKKAAMVELLVEVIRESDFYKNRGYFGEYRPFDSFKLREVKGHPIRFNGFIENGIESASDLIFILEEFVKGLRLAKDPGDYVTNWWPALDVVRRHCSADMVYRYAPDTETYRTHTSLYFAHLLQNLLEN